MNAPSEAGSPRASEQELVARLHALLSRHPLAVQAAYSALYAEGRRFAQTEEGELWREKLARSELVGRFRVLWDTLTQHAFEEVPTQAVPSLFLDALADVLASGRVEQLLTATFMKETA